MLKYWSLKLPASVHYATMFTLRENNKLFLWQIPLRMAIQKIFFINNLEGSIMVSGGGDDVIYHCR